MNLEIDRVYGVGKSIGLLTTFFWYPTLRLHRSDYMFYLYGFGFHIDIDSKVLSYPIVKEETRSWFIYRDDLR